MEIENKFSFEGKKVTVVGGKGKMGTAFAKGLASAGAKIAIVDRDTEPLGETPETDVVLFAVNERTTIDVLQTISGDVLGSIPLITTSSTNHLLHRWKTHKKTCELINFFGCVVTFEELHHLVPIHALCGPNMKGAVIIDCTEPDTLARSVASEIARIMKMETEHVPLEKHDTEIAKRQASFHARIWDFISKTPDLIQWARRLPVSQRRSAIGELRVLIRPDISAELISAFLKRGSNNTVLGQEFIFGSEDESPSEHSKSDILQEELLRIVQEKDPDGLIRDWVRTENGRMDEGAPGGPRSFQEFLRNKN